MAAKTITLAAALSLAFAAPASARTLTETAANRAALSTVSGLIPDDGADWPGSGADVWATSYELDPCDMAGRTRAYCAFSLTFTDGDVCDGEVTVRLARRGRIATLTEMLVCDSDGDSA
jgi:hypothetical protein